MIFHFDNITDFAMLMSQSIYLAIQILHLACNHYFANINGNIKQLDYNSAVPRKVCKIFLGKPCLSFD